MTAWWKTKKSKMTTQPSHNRHCKAYDPSFPWKQITLWGLGRSIASWWEQKWNKMKRIKSFAMSIVTWLSCLLGILFRFHQAIWLQHSPASNFFGKVQFTDRHPTCANIYKILHSSIVDVSSTSATRIATKTVCFLFDACNQWNTVNESIQL